MKPHLRCEDACHWARNGFSVIEAVIVLLIVAAVVGALSPSVVRQLTHARVNRAAYVVAADLLQAQSLAARQHAPVLVTIDSTAKTITLTDAASGTVLQTRRYGIESEFKIPSLSATQPSLMVLPNGTTSVTVTITLSGSSLTRRVSCTRAGQVRTW